MANAPNENTLERLVPDRIRNNETTGYDTLQLHIDRYRFAAKHARPDRILDIACGVGYGTWLLAEQAGSARRVCGVDLSADAIAYANERYAHEKITFRCADAMTFQDSDKFSAIVSLETIEHLPDPAGFIRHITTLLRPGGALIASVPTTLSTDINPYHLRDFTPSSFRKMLTGQGQLREIACYKQTQFVNPLSILKRDEARMSEIRPHLLRYYLRNPGPLMRRIATTLRYGFATHYLTLVCQKSDT